MRFSGRSAAPPRRAASISPAPCRSRAAVSPNRNSLRSVRRHAPATCSSSVYFESIETPANRAFVAAYRRRFRCRANVGRCRGLLSGRASPGAGGAPCALGGSVRRARGAAARCHPSAAGRGPCRPRHRHCYLTPRIGVSNAAGGFDIIYEAARPARPDPYLVWEEVKSSSGMRPTNLRLVK